MVHLEVLPMGEEGRQCVCCFVLNAGANAFCGTSRVQGIRWYGLDPSYALAGAASLAELITVYRY